MRNVRFISVFAAIGFILSFVFGLFSHSSFISILLKALLFGIIFVGLGFLISFIFCKFLSDTDSIDFSTDDSSENNNSIPSASVGQNVDIIVEDEELAPSESDNHFLVGDNHQMLKKTDIKDEDIDSEVERKSNYVPVRDFETSSNFSGTESVASAELKTSSDTDEQIDEDLDTLPDMESLSLSGGDDFSGGNDEAYTDSGFVSSTNTYKKSDGSTPDVKDASLIAKAISSALAEEDSL